MQVAPHGSTAPAQIESQSVVQQKSSSAHTQFWIAVSQQPGPAPASQQLLVAEEAVLVVQSMAHNTPVSHH
ncbi:MAG: hypothetical protein ACI9WU_004108 [Myxococcota bacterium]